MDSGISRKHVPIYGMIHLAGDEPVTRALWEMRVMADEGVDGVIIENYHGGLPDVMATLNALLIDRIDIDVGVNVLPNEYHESIPLAAGYGGSFVQLDHVAGHYTNGTLAADDFMEVRQAYPYISVMGGVWPKYYTPLVGSNLEDDIRDAMGRADALVVTGSGTGSETPIEKIMRFRKYAGDFPLIVGAGVTPDNAYRQLMIGDGAIVGTSLKHGDDTHAPVDRYRARDLMDVIRQVRRDKLDVSCNHYELLG